MRGPFPIPPPRAQRRLRAVPRRIDASVRTSTNSCEATSASHSVSRIRRPTPPEGGGGQPLNAGWYETCYELAETVRVSPDGLQLCVDELLNLSVLPPTSRCGFASGGVTWPRPVRALGPTSSTPRSLRKTPRGRSDVDRFVPNRECVTRARGTGRARRGARVLRATAAAFSRTSGGGEVCRARP